MALSQADLQSKMETNLVSRGFNLQNSGWMKDFLWAISKAWVDEVVQNSELVPVDTDHGTAGSGIITGKVK